MKESPFRITNPNAAGSNSKETTSNVMMEDPESKERFMFAQEEYHELFWKYIRQNNWKAIEAFVDKKVCYRFNLFVGQFTYFYFLVCFVF